MRPDAKLCRGKSPLNAERLHGHVFGRKATKQRLDPGFGKQREEEWFLMCRSRAFEEGLSWKAGVRAAEKPPV